MPGGLVFVFASFRMEVRLTARVTPSTTGDGGRSGGETGVCGV